MDGWMNGYVGGWVDGRETQICFARFRHSNGDESVIWTDVYIGGEESTTGTVPYARRRDGVRTFGCAE